MATIIYADHYMELPSEPPEMYKKRFHAKIQKETGLEKELVPLYKKFVHAADLSNGVVLYGEVKSAIMNELSAALGEDCAQECLQIMEKTYARALKAFEKKKLITWFTSLSGQRYPQIIGYNYFNDIEFYAACRKKGDDSWNGRRAVAYLDHYALCKLLHAGEEIREQAVMQTLLN